jgi:acetoin utilization deacetylase AcuC-like enzyme
MITRAAIVDLDAHQGDGNAKIMGENENIFILSMHHKDNYPLRKIPSSIDIGLSADDGDEVYNRRLKDALPHIINFQPDIIFYIAGVDPLHTDRLGKLKLTKQGLFERDKTVLEMSLRESIPIVLTMGGGYSRPIDLTVDAHVQTYSIAKTLFN